MKKLYKTNNRLSSYLNLKSSLIILLFSSSFCYSQENNLIGKWILVRTLFDTGKKIEINSPNYSSKLTYTISPDKLKINSQSFNSTFTSNKIKTPFRIINYSLRENYLLIQDEGDNKISYFLKIKDFIKKFPEFSLKEAQRNGITFYVDNDLSGYEFNNEHSFEEFIDKNTRDRSSKDFKNLNFQVEFILTAENKIKDIKILNSIDNDFDNDYINALKKAEPFLENISGKDLLIFKEVNQLKWANDLNDKEEKKLYKSRANGLEYFRNNKFEKAIVEFSQIQDLQIKNNRFKTLIKESLLNLGVSYLAIGNNDNACKIFNKIGDKTDFEIRNYLIDFCEKK